MEKTTDSLSRLMSQQISLTDAILPFVRFVSDADNQEKIFFLLQLLQTTRQDMVNVFLISGLKRSVLEELSRH